MDTGELLTLSDFIEPPTHNAVAVGTLSFAQLFDGKRSIKIPEYQRPYNWTREKAEDLIRDLEEYIKDNPPEGSAYYMGSILLYRHPSKQVLEVIDGQQRLTTLLILQATLTGELDPNYDLQLNGQVSRHAVWDVYQFFQQEKERIKRLAESFDLFHQLDFTVITCNQEDLAFTFFDTQNNRGVSLSAEDYLKAYHLREVNSEKLQDTLATHWEQAALRSQDQEAKHLKLSYLFYVLLYKGRVWKGQRDLRPESKEALLLTFQKKTENTKDDQSFPLYPNANNIRFTDVKLQADQSIWVASQHEITPQPTLYPFAIRQPLHKGHQFFLYTQKYYEIYLLIFAPENTHIQTSALREARNFYQLVYNQQMSAYLRAFMELCIVLYYDAFGDRALHQAIQYFDYFIGSLRLSKYYVRKEAVKNSLMGARNNLLDVICHAYLPEEVFDFIREEPALSSVYEKVEQLKLNPVRQAYIGRLESYYDDPNFEIKKRLSWIR